MKQLNELYFTRHLAVVRPDIDQAIAAAFKRGEPPKLTAEQDRVFTFTCGLMPGFPEAFATRAARDQHLGPFRGIVEFIPTTFAEIEQAGFPAHAIAIGPRFGEAGFETVSAAVLPALAAWIRETGDSVDLIAGRVRYAVGPDAVVRTAYPIFGHSRSDEEVFGTSAYVSQALTRLLASERSLTEAN